MDSLKKSLIMLVLIACCNPMLPSDHQKIGYYGASYLGANNKQLSPQKDARRKELLSKIPQLNKSLSKVEPGSTEYTRLLSLVTDFNKELASLNKELRSI